MEIKSHGVHDDEYDGKDQRDRERNHDAGAPAERQETDEQHDGQRFGKRMDEFPDRVLDYHRLIGDLFEIETLRHSRHELRRGARNVGSELQNIGALGHDDAEADCGLPLLAHHESRRIDIAMRHCGDIAQAEHAAIGLDRRFCDRLDTVESAGHPERHTLRLGLDDARWNHRVLPRQ